MATTEPIRNKQELRALAEYFRSRNNTDRPITRTQAWQIVRDAAAAVGATGHISCHSLRKTWGYHAWNSGKVK